MTKFAMSGTDHTALKKYLHELETQLFVSGTERLALFNEFVFLLRDQPPAWRVWHLDNFHCHRLPESLMIQLREELRVPMEVEA